MISLAKGQSMEAMPNLLVGSACLKMTFRLGSLTEKVVVWPATGFKSIWRSASERT